MSFGLTHSNGEKALKQDLKDNKNGIWHEKDQLLVMSAHAYGR